VSTGYGEMRETRSVAAICVLMGSHKGRGATLRGDKRILWGGQSGTLSPQLQLTVKRRGVRECNILLRTHPASKHTYLHRDRQIKTNK